MFSSTNLSNHVDDDIDHKETSDSEISACSCSDCSDKEDCTCYECENIGPKDLYLLHRAAYNDNCKSIRKYWYEFDEDVYDKRGFNVLHEAIFGNAKNAVKLLLEEGMSISEATDEPENEVYESNASDGNIYFCEDDGYRGKGIPWGSTALHMVAITNNSEIMQLLLQRAAEEWYFNFDRCDKSGISIVDRAVEEKNAKMLYRLLKNPKFFLINTEIDGEPVIQSLYRMNRVLGIKIIYKRKDDIAFEVTNERQETLLHILATANDTLMVRFLLKYTSMNVELKDENGLTILAIAINNSNCSMIKVIRKYRPKIEVNTFKNVAFGKIEREAKAELYEQYGSDYENTFDDLLEGEDFYKNNKKQYKKMLKNMVTKEIIENDSQLVELLKPTAEDKQPGDNKSYLQMALDQDDFEVLRQILNFNKTDMNYRANIDRRAITYQRKKLGKVGYKDFKMLKGELERTFSAFRGNPLKKLKARFEKYTLEMLEDIDFLCAMKLFKKPVIDGLIGFNKLNYKKELITFEQFRRILQIVIKQKKEQDSNNDLVYNPIRRGISRELMKYIILQAAHKNLDELTSGEEDGLEEEKELGEQVMFNLHLASQPIDVETSVEKQFIPLWRGIAFNRDRYDHDDARRYIKNKIDKIKTFYSDVCYHLSGKVAGRDEVLNQELEQQAIRLQESFIKLEKKEEIPHWTADNDKKFSSLRYLIQQYYTMEKDGFDKNILYYFLQKNPSLFNKINSLDHNFVTFFQRNPFVSASGLPRHSIRYALTLSRANTKKAFAPNPRYSYKTGKAKYPTTIGVVFLSLYPKAEYERERPMNVPKEHARKKLQIKPELLNEFEITFVGKMDHIVYATPIIFPNFDEAYSTKYMQYFGLTKKQYDEYYDAVRKYKREGPLHKKVLEKLRKHLTEFYQKKLMDIAINEAKKRRGELVFELPDGTYSTRTDYDNSEIRDMAIGLAAGKQMSNILKERKRKKKKKEKGRTKQNKVKSSSAKNKKAKRSGKYNTFKSKKMLNNRLIDKSIKRTRRKVSIKNRYLKPNKPLERTNKVIDAQPHVLKPANLGVFRKSARAQKHFTENNLLQFDKWYDIDAILYLTHSELEDGAKISYIFANQKECSFLGQLKKLLILRKPRAFGQKDLCFISTNPSRKGIESHHFIFGMLLGKDLLIVNPTGNLNADVCNILSSNDLKDIENIYISKTAIQLDHMEQNKLVSCGPISVELLQHFSQLPTENINKVFRDSVEKNKNGLKYREVDIVSVLPKSLKALILANDSNKYKQIAEDIRKNHLFMLKPVEKRNCEDFWDYYGQNADIQVLMRLWYTDERKRPIHTLMRQDDYFKEIFNRLQSKLLNVDEAKQDELTRSKQENNSKYISYYDSENSDGGNGDNSNQHSNLYCLQSVQSKQQPIYPEEEIKVKEDTIKSTHIEFPTGWFLNNALKYRYSRKRKRAEEEGAQDQKRRRLNYTFEND